jgi:hypothetical protein
LWVYIGKGNKEQIRDGDIRRKSGYICYCLKKIFFVVLQYLFLFIVRMFKDLNPGDVWFNEKQ